MKVQPRARKTAKATDRPSDGRTERRTPLDRIRDLFGLDLRTLAVCRLALAVVLIGNLVDRLRDVTAMYSDDGILPMEVLRAYREVVGSWQWSLHSLHGGTAFQVGMLLLAIVLAVALLVGFRTRWATVGSWILLLSLHARQPLLVTGGDVLLGMLLFWAIFVPWGSCWSLDARRKSRRDSSNEPSRVVHDQPVIAFSPATAAMLLQVALMYLLTGWGKCNEVWFTGEAIGNSLSYDLIARPLGQRLLQYPEFLRWLTWGTLALELIAPWLLFSPIYTKRLRFAATLALIGLHLGIEVTMRVTVFSFVSLAALTLFLPPQLWEVDWWRGWWRREANDRRPLFGDERPIVLRSDKPAWARVVNALVLLLLGYMLLTNVGWQLGGDSFLRGLPTWFTRTSDLLGFSQRWTMFVRPGPNDYRFAAVARLRDGTVVDVIRKGQPVDFQAADRWDGRAPTARWMLAFRELADDRNSWCRQSAAEYFFRQWNETHAASRQIELLDFMLVQVEPWVPGSLGPPMVRLAQVDSLQRGPHLNGQRHGRWTIYFPSGAVEAEGEYVDGKRQGPWVYYHENGQRSAAGDFLNDKEHGPWTHWMADGQKEGQGTYADGLLHGRWKFWYQDGQSAVVHYHRDHPVPSPPESEDLSLN